VARAAAVAVAVGCLPACGGSPPDYLSDQDEADLYASVLTVARKEMRLPDTIAVHPYLAVAVDSAGRPATDLDLFEYEPSVPLQLLQQVDSSFIPCTPARTGLCQESMYLVVSRIARFAERDAAIVVQSVDRTAHGLTQLVVRLRYRWGRWGVAGSHLAM
jgi:hypothetical protein